MKIYATNFDPNDLDNPGPSIDSGFESLDQVMKTLGCDYRTKSNRTVVYEGIVFSDFIFSIDGTDNNG